MKNEARLFKSLADETRLRILTGFFSLTGLDFIRLCGYIIILWEPKPDSANPWRTKPGRRVAWRPNRFAGCYLLFQGI